MQDSLDVANRKCIQGIEASSGVAGAKTVEDLEPANIYNEKNLKEKRMIKDSLVRWYFRHTAT